LNAINGLYLEKLNAILLLAVAKRGMEENDDQA
jgi:hypothetical protein